MTGLVMINDLYDYLSDLIKDVSHGIYYRYDYEFLIAVMMTANTTDFQVNKVTPILFDKYDSIYKLNKGSKDSIIDIIKATGNYNRKYSYIKGITSSLINDYDGIVPNDRNYLESLPGVGRKTTNVVLNELFNDCNIAVDTHVLRVSQRLGLVLFSDDVVIAERKLKAMIADDIRSDMGMKLLLFGRYNCKAKNPICESCGLVNNCLYEKRTK